MLRFAHPFNKAFKHKLKFCSNPHKIRPFENKIFNERCVNKIIPFYVLAAVGPILILTIFLTEAQWKKMGRMSIFISLSLKININSHQVHTICKPNHLFFYKNFILVLYKSCTRVVLKQPNV